ncbi:amino acid transporter [Melanomma pulvis-pyrius CBS 109.77]|uniref:Amino acid transporter n=1 Tax=Melanomma pulvis-pyrius CBS 109.77 TaxID=1314802 RepID=A0A6A6XRM3_9PLEO|nr:amino acid transporter [Melanomma pulvis-pyrius CBS 109.77]
MTTQDGKKRDPDTLHATDSLDTGTVDDIFKVAAKGSSDDLDDAILRANGHEAVLERQFSWLSAFGLGFSITNSWLGYLSCFGQNLVYGGPQTVIFGLIVAFAVQSTITMGLSELASAFPSSGGQYHFCYILAPPRTRRFAAYVIGWMSVLAWWIVTCSGISLAAVTLLGIVRFFHEDFVAQSWHTYLVYVATGTVTMIPLFVAPKKITWTVQASLYLSLVGCATLFVTVLAMKGKTQSRSFITQPGLGSSGWSDSTAWLLAISNAMYTFGGTDGAIHISEEMHLPGRRVPQIMGVTLVVGLLSSLPLFIALMFCMTDLDAVRSSPLPSLEIIYQATGSRVATSILMIWALAAYIVCLSAQWVTSGRIAWAFARDGGVPFATFFSKIDERLEFPVRTTVAAFAFVCLYGLLYLASTTAFNSIVTSAVLFLNITYVVPQAIVLVQGRGKSLPTRYLRLGYLGYFCNGFSMLWIVVLGVTICMPPSLPVTVGSMNYTSVCLVGLFSIIICFWFTTGKNFKGPQIDRDAIQAANALSQKKLKHSPA